MAVSEAVREKVRNLPTQPGVYLWKDEKGKIIYVGKAVNLRNRVTSYVRHDANRAPKVAAMVSHAADLETIVVATEMEALILENTLIKKYHPHYNIMLRDDKTYPYIKVTVQEDYPRIFMTRRVSRDGARYFGPFADSTAVHRVLKLMQRAYHIRSCRTMPTDRPCLQYHLHHCDAPCVHYITKADYGARVRQALDILEGRDSGISRSLQQQMEDAAESMEFEKAAMYRDQIKAIAVIQEQQNIVNTAGGDMDVIGLARQAGQTCVQIYTVRMGKLMGRETFSLDNSSDDDVPSLMEAVVDQYYSDGTFIPSEIVVPALEDLDGCERRLSQQKGRKVTVVIPQRGPKKQLLDMASENAVGLLEQKRLQWQHDVDKTTGAVEGLARILNLPCLPERMECFDISHTQGIETVASMVVFEHGQPAKKEYRRFKLKTVQGKPDDFKSMAEIMERRYGEKDWPMPDLIIIDGGKGQLAQAKNVFAELDVSWDKNHPLLLGVAKGADRKAGLGTLFFEPEGEGFSLPPDSPALHVIQHIRDESHDHAIGGHRKKRAKVKNTSSLETIEGVGPKRRQMLLKYMGGLQGLRNASVEEIAKVPGISQGLAEKIFWSLKH